jgi:hypothetical protein
MLGATPTCFGTACENLAADINRLKAADAVIRATDLLNKHFPTDKFATHHQPALARNETREMWRASRHFAATMGCQSAVALTLGSLAGLHEVELCDACDLAIQTPGHQLNRPVDSRFWHSPKPLAVVSEYLGGRAVTVAKYEHRAAECILCERRAPVCANPSIPLRKSTGSKQTSNHMCGVTSSISVTPPSARNRSAKSGSCDP